MNIHHGVFDHTTTNPTGHTRMAPGSLSLDLRSQGDAARRLGRTWSDFNGPVDRRIPSPVIENLCNAQQFLATLQNNLWPVNESGALDRRDNSMNETLEPPVDQEESVFRSACRCKFRVILDHHRQTDRVRGVLGPMSTLRPSRTH